MFGFSQDHHHQQQQPTTGQARAPQESKHHQAKSSSSSSRDRKSAPVRNPAPNLGSGQPARGQPSPSPSLPPSSSSSSFPFVPGAMHHAQSLHGKQRLPACCGTGFGCNSQHQQQQLHQPHQPHQRHLKPGSQRSLSSSVKIARKPEIDYSPFRGQEARRSFSSGGHRSSWDERFNALSQSLRDICGSPRPHSLFTRSVTAPNESQTPSRPKRSSDPSLRSRTAPRDIRSLLSRPHPPSSSCPVSTSTPKGHHRENRNGVTFSAVQPTVIRETEFIQRLTKNLNDIEGSDSALLPTLPPPFEDRTTSLDLDSLGISVPSLDMTSSCPDGIPCDADPEGGTSGVRSSADSEREGEHTQPLARSAIQLSSCLSSSSSSGLPPVPPGARGCCVSLPGSNFSSPGNTLLKPSSSGCLSRARSHMRRINSVFLDSNLQHLQQQQQQQQQQLQLQSVFAIDPSFKKITVRHEESSKSLEIELARVLFGDQGQNSPGGLRRRREAADDSSATAVTAAAAATTAAVVPLSSAVRSGILFKVAVKPRTVALEDLYVQLVGERTLRVGRLEAESDRATPTASSDSTVLDEVTLSSEVMGWTCSMTEDRRWLTIREALPLPQVDSAQTVSLSSSHSSIHHPGAADSSQSPALSSFSYYTPSPHPISSSYATSSSPFSSAAVEYSPGCSARYQPIVVGHQNSGRLSVVIRVPDEFEPEDIAIKRLDQRVLIRGRKRGQQQQLLQLQQQQLQLQQIGSCQLFGSAHQLSAQPNVAFPAAPAAEEEEGKGGPLPTHRHSIEEREGRAVDLSASPSPENAAERSSSSAPEVMVRDAGNAEDSSGGRGVGGGGGGFQPALSRSLSGQTASESLPWFSVTISLPCDALGRTLCAYVTPLKNLVIYAALSLSRRRRRRLSF